MRPTVSIRAQRHRYGTHTLYAQITTQERLAHINVLDVDLNIVNLAV